MKTDYKALRIEQSGAVAELILTGPGKGNALGPDFWREMPEAVRRLDGDGSVRAILLRGSGDHFTYGLDLPAMSEVLSPFLFGEDDAAQRAELIELTGRLQEATEGLACCRKPVIAAIHGWCIGGGLNLAAACDLRLCSQDARFSLREVKLALPADLGALQRLPRIIGEGYTRQLAYTGMDIDAGRALTMGLVNEVHPTADALLAAARALAQRIADNPPLVVQACKQVLEYCADKSVADGLRFMAVWNAGLIRSKDLAEAFAAFMEKRPAQFQGK